MKKLVSVISIVLLLFSCNEKSASFSDEDFKSLVNSVKAKDIPADKIVKYETLANKSMNTTANVPELLTENKPECTNLPTTIAQLNSGAGFEMYKFTSDAAAEATAMGFTGSIGKKELLIIQDYRRYKIVNCDGIQKKIGIGLRCFIHVKQIKAKFGGSLPNIAASAQLDMASATFSLKSLGFGMNGSLIADGLGSQGDYNVDNFGKLAVTFNNVLKALDDDNTKISINPVELP
ncbi:hypothetical protein [uncultured Chryseobacterium sp.]|uniref:hypothetical protein n=1 Tax=uncultured Chryseobacterium sp. TaxID=259322 RepID=UPI00258B4EF7|nr:hypothetical protein [uncultured Chryseobacterium sp.]